MTQSMLEGEQETENLTFTHFNLILLNSWVVSEESHIL